MIQRKVVCFCPLLILRNASYHPRKLSYPLFFLIFALPSITLFYFGVGESLGVTFFIGLGILLYGICYFLVHDTFIHQRFKVFKRSDSTYLRALRKAHKIHHKSFEKHHGSCFGMLIVPWKYVREARESSKS